MGYKDQLRKLRKDKGYSQVELSEMLGVSKSTIGAYETGDIKPSFNMLLKISEFFDVDIDYLASDLTIDFDNEAGINNNSFPKRLRELRKQKGLSQQGLAEELKLSNSSISMYERGYREPNLGVLVQIADYFKVTVDSLLGLDVLEDDYTFNAKAAKIAYVIYNDDALYKLFEIAKDKSTERVELIARLLQEMK